MSSYNYNFVVSKLPSLRGLSVIDSSLYFPYICGEKDLCTISFLGDTVCENRIPLFSSQILIFVN